MMAFLAFLAASISYGLATVVFPKVGLLDFPERYNLKRKRLPYPAGIIAVLVFLVFFTKISVFDEKYIGVFIAISLIGITSFIDDRTPLSPALRLFIQVLAAISIFVAGSRIYTLTHPFGGIIKLDSIVLDAGIFGSLPLLSGLFTIGWLLFTVNALNWLDGIPGQVSVVSCIAFFMLGMLSLLRNNEPQTAEIAFILAGIALAGCLFDFPPAKVLMGDTGSMFFGFMLGLLGIYSGGKVATVFLALGLPLLDALFVIVRRLSRGHSPLKGGRDHLHHLLRDRGYSERRVIVLTASIGTAFGAGALFMSTAQKGIAIIILIIVMLLLTKLAMSDRKPSDH